MSNHQPTINSQNQHQTSDNPSFLLKLTIGLIGSFAFLQVYSIQAILPIIMQDFLASETQAGMTVGATVLAIAIISPFMGMLSDAIGRKNVILAGLVALGVPTVLLGFAQNLTTLTFFRFLQGLAVPAITVVLIAYVGEEFRGKTVAKLMSFLCVRNGTWRFYGTVFDGAF